MLTVFIPSYNHEAYIYECLDAAVKIKIEGLKVLLIDDGSTDGTARIIEEFITGYQGSADVRLIKKKNGGLTSSLNMGLSLVDTEFLYLVASDDVLNPKGIVECVNVLRKSNELKFIIGGAQYYNGEKSIGSVYGEEHLKFFKMGAQNRQKNLFLNYPQPILLQSTVFRTSILRKINGWDQGIVLDDYQIYIKLFLLNLRINIDFMFEPNVNCVYYRQHSENAYKNTLRQFEMLIQVLNKYCPNEIRPKAIGEMAAYHVLIAFKTFRGKVAFKILNQSSDKILVIYYMHILILKRLKLL